MLLSSELCGSLILSEIHSLEDFNLSQNIWQSGTVDEHMAHVKETFRPERSFMGFLPVVPFVSSPELLLEIFRA